MANFDTSSWDGSASQWPTTEAYCADCLIDENPAGAKKVQDKCKLPFRKPGSSRPNVNAVRAMVTGARGLPAVQASPESKKKAANRIIGWYPQMFKKPAPESIYRMAGKKRPESKSILVKQADDLWFIGFWSNNAIDRDEEIITEAAHKEYHAWLNETGYKLPIVAMHQPQLPSMYHLLLFSLVETGDLSIKDYEKIMHKFYAPYTLAYADMVIDFGGVEFVMGRVVPEKRHIAEKMMLDDVDLGMSHGFRVLRKDGKLIERYRSFELSILPSELAANQITVGYFTGKNMMDEKLTKEQEEWLNKRFGEDAAEEGKAAIEDVRRVLKEAFAAKQLVLPQEIEETDPSETYEEWRNKLFEDLDVESLQSTLKAQAEALQGLLTQAKALEEKTTELERDEDDRLDEKIAVAFNRPAWPTIEGMQVDNQTLEQLKQAPPQAPDVESANDISNLFNWAGPKF